MDLGTEGLVGQPLVEPKEKRPPLTSVVQAVILKNT
jgi:hypothetical protein